MRLSSSLGGVIHTIDSIVIEDGKVKPVEIKTSRARPSTTPSLRRHYLMQLAMYCAALDVPEGYLVVLHLNQGVLKTYRVRFTWEQLNEVGMWVEERRRLIERALEARDPMLAPAVAGDPELDWKCCNCPYWALCRGKQVSVAVDFPEPLLPGAGYEGWLLREAEAAERFGCRVQFARDGEGRIIGLRASGDVVKLTPLRRAAKDIVDRLKGVVS